MKTVAELRGDPLAMPSHFTLSQFADTFKLFVVKETNFAGMLGNSIWQCFGSSALSVIASFLVAYPLARYNFPGKKLIYLVIIFRITIPIVGTAPAQYKMFRDLDMLNNPSLFWLAWLNGFDFTTLVLYGFLRGISKSYSEAAYLDGANRFTIMWKVILPQALPCMIAMFITQVLVKWNDYTTPQLYLRDYPNLAYGLYVFKDIVNAEGISMSIYYSAIILAAIPPLILYAVGQRTMLKNVSIGGVKE